MILGEDPHKKTVTTAAPAHVTRIVDKFNYLARKHGAQTIPVNEIPIFRSHIKRMLNSGVSTEALDSNVRAFFSFAKYVEHPRPWRVFVAKEVQATLMRRNDAVKVSTADPVLEWVLSDFTVVDDLPWDRCEDKVYRNMILAHIDLLYRYPEVVAEALVQTELSARVRHSVLVLLTELLDERLDREDRKAVQLKISQYGIRVPKSLWTGTAVRSAATTLAEAVARSQR